MIVSVIVFVDVVVDVGQLLLLALLFTQSVLINKDKYKQKKRKKKKYNSSKIDTYGN